MPFETVKRVTVMLGTTRPELMKKANLFWKEILNRKVSSGSEFPNKKAQEVSALKERNKHKKPFNTDL